MLCTGRLEAKAAATANAEEIPQKSQILINYSQSEDTEEGYCVVPVLFDVKRLEQNIQIACPTDLCEKTKI
jgi:hypothetical protein